MMRVLLYAMLVLLPCAALAATTGEEDSMLINRLNSADFEVVETRSMGAADFWCGAATFVERRSGLSELTPIYLKRARGPSVSVPGRKSVVFSINDVGLPPAQPHQTLSVKREGDSLRSVQARRFCRDAFTRSTK